MEYLGSAVIVVSSKPRVGSSKTSPRTNMKCFSLTLCTDELLSTRKTIPFLPQSKNRYEKSEGE